jgi:hypothetical protein
MTEQANIVNSKKAGVADYLPIILAAAAVILSAIGLIRVANIYRQIIYAGQVLISVYMLIQMCIHIKDGGRGYLKATLYALALLEALRATILVTIGVNTMAGYVARFILIILACSCVLTAERIGSAVGEKAAISIVVLETVLYLVFLFGFPGILLGHLNRFLPLASILMSVGICILVKTGNAQMTDSEKTDSDSVNP